MPWTETLAFTASEALEIPNADDDLNRELALYVRNEFAHESILMLDLVVTNRHSPLRILPAPNSPLPNSHSPALPTTLPKWSKAIRIWSG